ncbi:thiamine-phosphate kinase [Hydrogenophilus hirschii]
MGKIDEFTLIARFFRSCAPPEPSILGIGDDAALLPCASALRGNRDDASAALALTTDTLVAGSHFLPDFAPQDLGWKALAVNLSDLAAMGAEPTAFLLALTLPRYDPEWLEGFARGVQACAQRYGVALIGGDTTRGPLAITITALGVVPWQAAIRRSTAQVGDDLWVSGQPGRAALGLSVRTGRLSGDLPGCSEWIAALERPQPRIALGLALRGIATAMLDISDGLTQDAHHLVETRPELTLCVEEAALPLAPLVAQGAPAEKAWAALLGGGDDYELLFTANPRHRTAVAEAARRAGVSVHRIGSVVPRSIPEASPLVLLRRDGTRTTLPPQGWDPFRVAEPLDLDIQPESFS